jgi:hypothetical protein
MTGDDDNEYWHNRGQTDASQGDYSPPWSGINPKVSYENEQAYKDGYYHSKGQSDRARGVYDNPYTVPFSASATREHDAYNSGYHSKDGGSGK